MRGTAGKGILLTVFIAAIIIGGVLLVRQGTGGNPPTAPKVIFKPVKAPDFTLTLLSGKKVRLSDFKNKKPVVINFWASWCGPCRAEAPVLSRIAKTFDGKVEFIGVAVQDTPENAKEFIDQFDMPYKNGIDDGSAAAAYKVTGIPTTVFINKRGQIVDSWVGAIEGTNLIARLKKIL